MIFFYTASPSSSLSLLYLFTQAQCKRRPGSWAAKSKGCQREKEPCSKVFILAAGEGCLLKQFSLHPPTCWLQQLQHFLTCTLRIYQNRVLVLLHVNISLLIPSQGVSTILITKVVSHPRHSLPCCLICIEASETCKHIPVLSQPHRAIQAHQQPFPGGGFEPHKS